MKKFILIVISVISSVVCSAQNAGAIVNEMSKYSDIVDQKQTIYYFIDDKGKVNDVRMSMTIPEDAQEKITSFFKTLPQFFGAPGARATYIFPSENSKPKQDTGRGSITGSDDGDRRAIGQLTVDGNSDEGAILTVKNSNKNDKTIEQKVFDVVETMPSYPGGQQALMEFLSTHVKYPLISEENGIAGRIVATFVVEKDGSISDVKVVIGNEYYLEQEAIRVVKAMPKWIPGKQNGSAVRVKFTMPITFRLQ